MILPVTQHSETWHMRTCIVHTDRDARESDGPPKKYVDVHPPGKWHLDEVKTWFGKKPSRIKMDLGGFVPHELRQNHPKTQLCGKDDFRALRCVSCWFQDVQALLYLGLSPLILVLTFWWLENHESHHGPLIPRQTLAYGPGGSIDKPLAATGILGSAVKRAPPIFIHFLQWKLGPTANQKSLVTSPYISDWFAGPQPQLSCWGCSLDPWDSPQILLRQSTEDEATKTVNHCCQQDN